MTIDQIPTGRLRLSPCYHNFGHGPMIALEKEVRHSQPVPHGTWWIPATAKDLENDLCKAWLEEHCPKLGTLLNTTA